MSTRDLGSHVVELHEKGMLTITGEGTRVVLPAHEAADLLEWLNHNQAKLQSPRQFLEEEEGVVLKQVTDNKNISPEEREIPVDEP